MAPSRCVAVVVNCPPFHVTWDYRCPFARNVHEHLIAALQAGAPWEVTFVPFSLTQAHVHEGEPTAWENPGAWPDLLALEAGVVVRDRYPDRFLGAHRALFAARHDQGGDLRERDVVAEALEASGVPAADVLREVDSGWPRLLVQEEHEAAVDDHGVFGVPTFIVEKNAAFARIMHRPNGDGHTARATIERLIAMIVDHPEINELKHTTIPR